MGLRNKHKVKKTRRQVRSLSLFSLSLCKLKTCPEGAFWGDRTSVYRGSGYPGVYICQSSLNCILKLNLNTGKTMYMNAQTCAYSLLCGWWECKMLHPLWGTAWQFLKKWNIHLPYDPTILLLGVCIREMKAYVHTKTCVTMFVAAYSDQPNTRKSPNAHEPVPS